MAIQKYKTARAVAIMVLSRFEPARNYVSPILNKLLDETDQKQRATDLVYGTIRNQNAIDTVIATFSGRLAHRIPSKLLNIIRVAVFELVYSPGRTAERSRSPTPEYSIVNEAVENAKAVGGKRQTSFVNAVLRQITRHISNRQIRLSKANPEATLPQTSLTGCEFDTCFLPDPKVSLADYLSIAFSLPKWLITDWLGEFGKDPTRQICFASNRRPSIYLRPNVLKITTQELGEKLRQADIELEIVDTRCWMPDARRVSRIENLFDCAQGRQESRMIRIKSPRAVTEDVRLSSVEALPGFAEGLFTVQDISAANAAKILDPQTGSTILDLCAAPGTKTTQLAEATKDSATIIATDIDSQRLQMVKENTTRLGINSVNIVPYERVLNSKFDCVLLDVPCSNTGVLAKRIEARFRLKPKVIKELTKIQNELLHKAATMTKHEGKICYSTCSIQRCENSELVKDFLKKNRSFKLESEKLILPSARPGLDHDGGYVAVLKRK